LGCQRIKFLLSPRAILSDEKKSILAIKIFLYLVIAGFLLFQSLIPAIEIDDAYISFRYACNFAQGNGLVFNVGERVEGYSNFLWVILLSIGSRTGLELPLFAKWTGVFFTLLSILFCLFILRRGSNRSSVHFWRESFTLSILILSFPSILYWTSGALETPLFMFSLVFAAWCVTSNNQPASSALIKGVGMILPALVRFDGIIFSVILVFFVFAQYKKGASLRTIILPILFCIIVVGTYHIWRIEYYGSFLPNTVISKGSTGFWRLLRGGVSYMVDFITVNNIPVFFIPVLFVWIFRLGFSRMEQLLISFVLFYGGFIVTVRGDCMIGHRYATPLLLPIILLAILSARRFPSELIGQRQSKFSVAFLVIPLILATVHFMGYYTRDFHKRYKWYWGQDYRAIAHYLNAKKLENASLAISEIGIPSYFFRGDIIDVWGIADKTVALIKKKHKIPITVFEFGDNAVPEFRGTATKEIADYVLSRHPTAIYYALDHGFYEALGEERLEKLGYRPVNIEGVRFPLLVNFRLNQGG